MPGVELRERRADNFKSFFRSWMQNPLAIGAVAPSSRLLAKMMAMNLVAGDRVIELGAGTGTVTQAILDTGVHPRDLFVVEQNEQFVKVLRNRFRSSPVIEADAMLIADHLRGVAGSVDFIISGLPLLLFSAEQKVKLLSQAFPRAASRRSVAAVHLRRALSGRARSAHEIADRELLDRIRPFQPTTSIRVPLWPRLTVQRACCESAGGRFPHCWRPHCSQVARPSNRSRRRRSLGGR